MLQESLFSRCQPVKDDYWRAWAIAAGLWCGFYCLGFVEHDAAPAHAQQPSASTCLDATGHRPPTSRVLLLRLLLLRPLSHKRAITS